MLFLFCLLLDILHCILFTTSSIIIYVILSNMLCAILKFLFVNKMQILHVHRRRVIGRRVSSCRKVDFFLNLSELTEHYQESMSDPSTKWQCRFYCCRSAVSVDGALIAILLHFRAVFDIENRSLLANVLSHNDCSVTV